MGNKMKTFCFLFRTTRKAAFQELNSQFLHFAIFSFYFSHQTYIFIQQLGWRCKVKIKSKGKQVKYDQVSHFSLLLALPHRRQDKFCGISDSTKMINSFRCVHKMKFSRKQTKKLIKLFFRMMETVSFSFVKRKMSSSILWLMSVSNHNFSPYATL